MSDLKADIKHVAERAIHKTKFEGMLLIDLSIYEDFRGSFTEVWQTEEMQKLGLPELHPQQLGISRSKRGTIRGVHAEPWEKLVCILDGKAFIAIADFRTDSKTFGEVETFELGATRALFLPKGMGNSMQTISDQDVLYCYFVTGLWSSELAYSGEYPAVTIDDPDLNIDWPLKGDDQIVSIKDKNNKTLRQVFPEKFDE